MAISELAEVVSETMTFEDYLAYSRHLLVSRHRPTIYDAEEVLRYTKSNLDRMESKLKTITINKKIYNQLIENERDWLWLVISEPWCGDAAQILPVLYSMSQCNEKISFRILLRDVHEDIMQQYLTNGAKSIPKLICFDQQADRELGLWGPRPKAIQQIVMSYKQDPDMPQKDFIKKVHQWYEDDSDQTIQEEFLVLINQWINK